MRINGFIFLLTLLFISSKGITQSYPQDYFRSPLDIPLYLSGTFGEIRSNHFHSGIDIRTQEKPGFKVYAIADGFVSRIKIAPGGYGRALYITHPNGYVSVYGHLSRFNGELDEYIFNEHYRRESYSMDIYFDKGRFPVKKGDVVAFTGDSGRSGGPHLHFEIRDEATQKPINPLLFGFEVEDKNRPLINILKVYPADYNSSINGNHKEVEIYTHWENGKYFLNGSDTITISGKAYFGINTYDPFNGGKNKNGVFCICLDKDSIQIYSHKLETFSFDETRYINSFTDYKEFVQKRRTIQKSYIQPNNRLTIYGGVINRGIINFNDNSVHKITYVVKDIKGNTSGLVFYVKAVQPVHTKPPVHQGERLFTYTGVNTFQQDGIRLTVPGKALYDTIYFKYAVLPAPTGGLSPLYRLHYDYVPLHTWCTLELDAGNIPPNLLGKALIVKIDDKGKTDPAGGKFIAGNISARIREFGNYFITVDTIAPEIIPVNIRNGKNIAKQNTIKVKITDNLSGIKSYRPELNGKWILMEYDAKNDLLIYRFDDRLKRGENIFKLTVTDEKGNSNIYRAKVVN